MITDTTRPSRLFLTVLLILALPAIPLPAKSVQENWTEHCAVCHGEDGRGRTKSGRELRIPDLTKPSEQAKRDLNSMRKSLEEGNYDEQGSERMPPFKEVLRRSEREALIRYVRGFVR